MAIRQKRKGRGQYKTRKYRGGGSGIGGYTFGGPITPGAPVGNTAEVIPMESCLATQRPGMIGFPTGSLGLPGMSGGRRRRVSRRAASRKGTRKQKGGRYSFDLSQQLTPGAPWAGGIPQVVRIPCESSSTTANPLNMRGGAGLGGTPAYYAPTAGYTNSASSWVGATGAPSLIQTPYDARAMNQACLKTGGGRRGRGRASRKMTRRSRRR